MQAVPSAAATRDRSGTAMIREAGNIPPERAAQIEAIRLAATDAVRDAPQEMRREMRMPARVAMQKRLRKAG